jgi:hypothetical protein
MGWSYQLVESSDLSIYKLTTQPYQIICTYIPHNTNYASLGTEG